MSLVTNLILYLGCFLKTPFFLSIKVCNISASSYVIMADYVVKFQSNRVNLAPSRGFSFANYVTYLQRFFSESRDAVLAFSEISSHSYIRRRDFYSFGERQSRESS